MKHFIKTYLLFVIFESIIFNSCNCSNNKNAQNDTKYLSTIKNCGQIFKGFNEYLIKSPNYPDNYKNNLNCVYKLIVNESSSDDDYCPNREYNINFVDFQIEKSYNCSNDFLKIGKDNYYCGNQSTKNYKKFFNDNDDDDNNNIDIVFHSNDNDVNGKGFVILITFKKCPKIFFNDTKTEIILKDDDDKDRIENDDNNQSTEIFLKNDHKIVSKIGEGLKIPGERIELPIFGSENFHDDSSSSSFSSFSSTPSITSYLYIPKKNFEIIPETDIEDSKKVLNLFFIPPKEQNSGPSSIPEISQENPKRWSIYGVPDSLDENFDNKNYWSDNINNNNKETKRPNFDSVYPSSSSSSSSLYPEFPFEDSFSDPSFGVSINEAQWNTDDGGSSSFDSSNSECCSGSSYSSQNFLLTSPGFPNLFPSSSNNYDCRYTIQRSSQNVCRLNLNFKYFNFGNDDRFCAYGYIEIDGERYCGCKTGENLTTSFDNIGTKIISVKKFGKSIVGKFSGFVIEVSQESCPTGGYYYDESLSNRNFGGFFVNQGNLITGMRNIFNQGSCRILKFLNWVKAAKQVYRTNAKCSRNSIYSSGISSLVSVIPIFPEKANSLIFGNAYHPSNANCESINIVEGTISSVYYPNDYPNGLNRCYRFVKAPGYCQIELSMIDFDLEESRSCRKDYVIFSGLNRRYCGVSLAGSRTIFDLTRSNYAEFYFVTDSSGNGRGFRAGFSQISCSGETPKSSTNSEPINYY